MEFVLVTFPRVRPVRMDGATQGHTGQMIAVQRGVHIFDLGLPLDYTPPSVQTSLFSLERMNHSTSRTDTLAASASDPSFW